MADADFSVKAIISAQTSQFEKGIKNAQSSINSMSKSIEGVQKLLKGAFSVVGIGATIKAVTSFGKSCVQSATQATKQFNILDNTIKATGADAWTSTEKLTQASKALSKSTNYSVTEIQRMQSVLLGFTNITGEAFDEASDAVLDMATVMGMDLTSAVQTVGKALDDPISGLDSLRRQGFKFTEEQKMELAQLVKNGKQLEAQKIILDSLATSYGGAAKAGQDSFAKQRHAVENFRDSLGSKLIPIVKVFAEDNANMLDSLRESIEKVDLTSVINVITNLKEKFSDLFETVSSYVKKGVSEIQDFMSRFNFQPLISVLDTFIGVVISLIGKFKELNSQRLDVFDNIKESLISFSNSEMFKKVTDFVNKVIEAIYTLAVQVINIGEQIKDLIVNSVIVKIWEKFKELFNNSNKALAESEGNIKSWSDFFWTELDNIYRTFQDVFGLISSVLKGDWEVAWNYAKLAVLRVVDSIITGWDTMINSFSDKMKTIVSVASIASKIIPGTGIVGKEINAALSALSALSNGIEEGNNKIKQSIDSTEKKIEELTGKPADTSIKNLGKISHAFSGFTAGVLGDIQELTEGATSSANVVYETYTGELEETKKKSSKILGQISAGFEALKEQITKDANDWSDVVSTAYNAIKDSFGEVFTSLGESLVEGGKGFENYAAMAVKALAEVLKGLGEQLLAIAAVNLATKQYASAAIAAAGAAAAFVASGVLNAIASSMMSAADETEEASNQIEHVGNVAISSSYSLEEFINKLKEIKGLFTGTAVSIMQTYRGLSTATTTAISEYKKASDAYNQYYAGVYQAVQERERIRNQSAWDFWRERYGVMFYMGEDIANKYKKEVLDQYDQALSYYDALKNKLNEMAQAYRQASLEVINLTKNTIASYKSSILENRIAISNYYEVLDAQRKVIELQEKWNSMTEAQRQADINAYNYVLSGGVGDITNTLTYQLELYNGFVESLLLEQKLNIQTLTSEAYSAISSTGVNIGSTLVKSIISGATKQDFLSSMKDYISENLVQIAIYTEEFEDRLAEIGAKLSRALLGVGENDIRDIRNELEDLWDKTEKKAKEAGAIIKEVFADVESSINQNVKSFGEEISNTLVDSLTSGLGQSGFMDSIKEFIRKMLVQTLVYTESMQAEIESIGAAISKGIREGFTDTTLHEIRRDLSWTFEEANRTLENIDSVLGSVFSGYATGTNNATAGLHLVGEAGPELVRFHGGEQVYNNAETRQMMGNGSSGNTFNVTFQNTKDTTAFSMMQQFKQYNREMAINGVI